MMYNEQVAVLGRAPVVLSEKSARIRRRRRKITKRVRQVNTSKNGPRLSDLSSTRGYCKAFESTPRLLFL